MKKIFIISLFFLSFAFYAKADSKYNLENISKTHKINTLYLNKMFANKNLLDIEINKVDIRNYKNNFTFNYSDLELNKKYPTPLNHLTLIKYYIPTKTQVELNLYNLLGNKLKTLVNATVKPGEHYLAFDDNKLNPGLYIYQLKTNLGIRTKKMIYFKENILK